MKKVYEAPKLEIELYELSASIASNCGVVISMGPAAPGHSACGSFITTDEGDGLFGDDSEITFNYGTPQAGYKGQHNVTFYDDVNCDCYTTGGNGSFWMS